MARPRAAIRLLREAAGTELFELDLPDGSGRGTAWRLAEVHPSLAGRRRSLAVAVNRRYASFPRNRSRRKTKVVFVPR